MKNPSEMVQNLPQIDKKRPWIDEHTSLDRFRRQIVPMSALGRPTQLGGLEFYSLFDRKWRSKDQFWDPRKIKDLRKMVRRFVGLRFFFGFAGFVMWNFVKGNVNSFMLKRHQNF